MAIAGAKKTRRGRPKVDSEAVNVRMSRGLLAAIDAYIAERAATSVPEALSRPEAIRQLAAEALIGMGLLKP